MSKTRIEEAWGAIDEDGELILKSIGDNKGAPMTYFEDQRGMDWEQAHDSGYRVVKVYLNYEIPGGDEE